jgi:hypothetical protein
MIICRQPPVLKVFLINVYDTNKFKYYNTEGNGVGQLAHIKPRHAAAEGAKQVGSDRAELASDI